MRGLGQPGLSADLSAPGGTQHMWAGPLARGLEQAAGKEEEPSALASRCEALEQIRACLSSDDWEVFVSRASGESWQDIAERLGSTPDALRMHFQRVIRELEGIIVSL